MTQDMFGHQMRVHLRPDDVPQCVIIFIQCKQTRIWHLGVFNYCDPVKNKKKLNSNIMLLLPFTNCTVMGQ